MPYLYLCNISLVHGIFIVLCCGLGPKKKKGLVTIAIEGQRSSNIKSIKIFLEVQKSMICESHHVGSLQFEVLTHKLIQKCARFVLNIGV